MTPITYIVKATTPKQLGVGPSFRTI